MHSLGSKQSNVDALSMNLVGHVKEDDDFLGEIQKCNWLQVPQEIKDIY
jgi:hypothetical protein